MQIKTLVGALASLFIVAAEGKTVAWYHFDGGADGERAKADVDFVNAADATSLPAHSRWLSAAIISKMDSENLSSYAYTFPEGVVWTDGVSVSIVDEPLCHREYAGSEAASAAFVMIWSTAALSPSAPPSK